ncbi:deaminase [Cnuibacter physcomitrellae]|uniref:Deaminase n=1 Tax=Cnuibacter physcomitrellae TaxID=1619308 RepID=A0A1X9LHU4_9MICO|nr:dihydrofolate reductase family protein [Cnuibacter physcomitrellae]ARJ04775.1 deaminase [Cnuibacter physcomitrellae]GGI41911.1 deaminase [Cnuibacter physcomitrellae]
MRRLVYYVATTIDGFIAEPDRGDPTGRASFPVTDDVVRFIVETYPETLPAAVRAALGIDDPGRSFDTVLEGRGSYEVGLAAGVTDAYPHLRHLVFSSTLSGTPDPAVELVVGDAVERVRELKREPGLDLWLVGGGGLAHSLLPEIDRLVLKVTPAVIGAGVPLFDGPFTPHSFHPTEEIRLPGGVRVVTYDRQAAADPAETVEPAAGE